VQDEVVLKLLLNADSGSESAWLSLADAVSVSAERRFCLQQVLTLNRRNALARRALEELGPGPVRCPLLPYALAALEDGREQDARRILETIVQADPRSEMGWLALAAAVDAKPERRYCLERVLEINHRNALARRALERQGNGPAYSPLLAKARAALEIGRRNEGRATLESVLQVTPESERAWQALADAVDTDPERRYCFERVLGINPSNGVAARELEVLGPGAAWSPLENTVAMPEGVERASSAAVPRWLQRLRGFLSDHVVLLAVMYLVVLTAAEVLTTIIKPRVGLVMHAVLLVLLLVHTAVSWGRPGYRFVLTLTLALLIRILSLSLPLTPFPLIYWYFIVSVPLFAATFVVIWTLGYRLTEVGLNLRAVPLQILVALTGLTLGVFEYSILRPDPLTVGPALHETWLPALILLFCTGFAEELIFRGVMQRASRAAMGVWGIVYVAVVFAVLHVGYHSVADVLFVFGVAVFFGMVTAYTESIVGVSLAHGLTNILLFLSLPFGKHPFDLIANFVSRLW